MCISLLYRSLVPVPSSPLLSSPVPFVAAIAIEITYYSTKYTHSTSPERESCPVSCPVLAWSLVGRPIDAARLPSPPHRALSTERPLPLYCTPELILILILIFTYCTVLPGKIITRFLFLIAMVCLLVLQLVGDAEVRETRSAGVVVTTDNLTTVAV